MSLCVKLQSKASCSTYRVISPAHCLHPLSNLVKGVTILDNPLFRLLEAPKSSCDHITVVFIFVEEASEGMLLCRKYHREMLSRSREQRSSGIAFDSPSSTCMCAFLAQDDFGKCGRYAERISEFISQVIMTVNLASCQPLKKLACNILAGIF